MKTHLSPFRFPLTIGLILFLLSLAGSWQEPRDVLRKGTETAYGVRPELPWSNLSQLKALAGRNDFPPSLSRLDLPADYQTTSAGGRLIFAHVADGKIPGTDRFMVTTFMLSNDAAYEATGTIEFYQDAGTPMPVTIDGVTSSTFPVVLAGGEVKRVMTAGKGSGTSGWARVLTDQPISGTSSFSIRDPRGRVYADVGVAEATLARSFTVFADSMGTANTALALANPSSTASLDVTLDLHRADGSAASTTTWTVPPLGHRAQFLNEIFGRVGSIGEFEGSVRISVPSGQKIGGITLRTLGSLLTSVPMVPPYDPNDDRTQLAFPHVADGSGSGLSILTMVIVFNNTPAAATGTLEFIRSNGTPMTVKVDGRVSSNFTFNLPPGGVKRFRTAGDGDIKTGWARVTMDQPLNGTAIFHVAGANGQPITEVGVDAAVPLEDCLVLADSTQAFRTGLAMANPGDRDAEIDLGLFNKSGEELSQKEVVLTPGTHQALFFDEVFADVPGIDEFEGRVEVSADEAIIVLSLRQVGVLTTSVPIHTALHGFFPDSVLEFAQNLQGTRPAIRWRINQPGTDLSLEMLQISAPQLGFDQTDIEIGDKIGYGYYLGNFGGFLSLGGLVELVATEKGSVKFDVLASGPYISPMTVLFSGSLDGTPSGGFTLNLGPTQTRNGEWNKNLGLELDLMFRPGMIIAPRKAKAAISMTYTSASTKISEGEVSIVRTSTYSYPFISQGTGPSITSVAPLFVTPGQLLEIKGSGFGNQPTVGFFTRGDGATLINAKAVGTDTLLIVAPEDFIPVATWIVKDEKAGNPHLVGSLFAPVVNVTRTTQEDVPDINFRVDISLDEAQLMVQRWELDMVNVDRRLSGLPADTRVGTAQTLGGTQPGAKIDYEMLVESSSADELVLSVIEEDETEPVAKISITRTTEPEGLRFSYNPIAPSETPILNGFPTQMVFEFTGLAITLPAPPEVSTWHAALVSTPAGLVGAESGLTVILGQ